MKVDGLAPGQGNPADKLGGVKRTQAAPGKSFADALKKAGQAPSQPASQAPSAYPVHSTPHAPNPAAPPPATSSEDHISTIKHRLQTGYYDSKKVNDALGEKLSDYFDELT